MLIYLKAFFLAVVEGATEFIPVSSTGHMILVDEYVRLSADKDFARAFMIIIQLPAILAVVVYFWNELWPFRSDPAERAQRFRLWAKILVAFVPTAILGVLFEDIMDRYLFNSLTVASALVVGGIVLVMLERRRPAPTVPTIHSLSFTQAFWIGVFQCLAMIPGTSRSAATIIGAMLLGAGRPVAAEFSFLLAIPTMLGATVFKVGDVGANFTNEQWGVLGVGSITSFLVAYSVVAVFMRYIQRRDFRPFGYYRIVLGFAVLLHFAYTHTS